jgi:hypothetical protein
MNDFKTIAFSRKVELSFSHPCEIVSPFFDPKWRNLLYQWWRPEILAPPIGPGLTGLVQRVTPPSLSAGSGIILSVHDHNQQDWQIYYSVVWGDYELQQIRINCSPNTSGGTDAVWTEKIAGFGSHGVKPVSEFVNTKTLESRVNTYRNAIDAHISGKDPGKFNGHLKMYGDGVIPQQTDLDE